MSKSRNPMFPHMAHPGYPHEGHPHFDHAEHFNDLHDHVSEHGYVHPSRLPKPNMPRKPKRF